MVDCEPKKFERYLVNMNEPVDRLTTNRIFQRIYEDIDNINSKKGISLRQCTDNIYGTARFSSASSYEFYEGNVNSSTSADYYDGILTTTILKDYSDSISDSISSSVYWASTTNDSIESTNYWLKTDYANVDFTYMPNGVTIVTGTLELGFNNIQTIFGGGTSMLSGDVMTPYSLSGYDTYINITEGDVMNITEYSDYNEYSDISNVLKLKDMDGRKVRIPFSETVEATLHHNICNWTTYSDYRQSFVELHFSSSIDIKSLYEKNYHKDTFELYGKTIEAQNTIDTKMEFRHPKIAFEQKPVVMMQVGFYGGANDATVVFGHDNRLSSSEAITSVFHDYDTITEQPLTINSDNEELSPVNGHVEIKKIENIYDDYGIITNNIVHFDVVMKFMVGSASDPKMVYGLTTINSRAKVQFALIGV